MKIKTMLLATISSLALVAGASTASAQNAERGAAAPEAKMNAPAGGQSAKEMAPRGEAKGYETAPGQTKERMGNARDEAAEKRMDRVKADKSRGDMDDMSGKRDKQARDGSGYESRDGEKKAEKSRDGDKKADADRARSGGGQKSAKVDVDKSKKTSLKKKVDRSSLKRTDVDINVNVGVSLPSSVRLYPLPTTWISIVPEYEGYEYIYVDGMICIVDPGTLLIVDVIYV